MGNTGSGSVDMNSQEAKFIQSEVSQNCVVIFSKTTCPYCRACKQTFSKLGVEPRVIEIDNRDDCYVLQDILENMTGARTVPRVFINGNCIGGNSETRALYSNGKLAEMVAACAS